MDYAALAKDIHQTAKDKGFWDNERDMEEMLALAISELAEALEEDREGTPPVYWRHACDYYPTQDTQTPKCKLCTPKPEGFVIEVADCLIRCLDTLQHICSDIPYFVGIVKQVVNLEKTLSKRDSASLYRIMQTLTRVKESDVVSSYQLVKAALMCEALISRKGWNAYDAMQIKMTYNNTREHMHGKAY